MEGEMVGIFKKKRNEKRREGACMHHGGRDGEREPRLASLLTYLSTNEIRHDTIPPANAEAADFDLPMP